MARRPAVLSTSPASYERDVVVSKSIQVEFDIDLDARYINDFVKMMDADGKIVDGRVTYRKKILTFTPHTPLSEGMEYHMRLIGDTDIPVCTCPNECTCEPDEKEGLRSIVGVCMAGIFTFSFTTEAKNLLPPPEVVHPVHHSVQKENPVFEWMPVNEAAHYELQISTTNTFSYTVFPTLDDTRLSVLSVEPDIEWEDKNYYWRVRSIDADGAPGAWGAVNQFNLSRHEEGTISAEDSAPIDFMDADSFELELISSSPADLSIQVPVNRRAFYFRVIGDVNLSLIDSDSIHLEGWHISEDEQEESHGKVEGKTQIVRANDGTVYIVYLIDPFPVNEGGE